jgi:serine/threonine protein kinase
MAAESGLAASLGGAVSSNEVNAVLRDALEAAAAAAVTAETIIELLEDAIASHLSLETYPSGSEVNLLSLRRQVLRGFSEVVACKERIINQSRALSQGSDAAAAMATSTALLKLRTDIQAFVDSLDELSGENSVMAKLGTNFSSQCLFGVRALSSLVEAAAEHSWPVNIKSIYSPWDLYSAQLHDWKDVILRLEDISRLLRRDEIANATDIINNEKALKALRTQYPEPPVFNRVDPSFKFTFHIMEDPFPDTPEGVTANAIAPSTNTNFGIVMGAPVCVKSIDAISLKRGTEVLKEVVHMYTYRNKDVSAAHVTVPLQVHFDAEAQRVSMVFSLAPLGNLSHVVSRFVDRRASESHTAATLDAASTMWNEMARSQARYSIAADMSKGLQYLHSRGIVHGSIKPANVLIFDGHRAKLSDFGMAPYLRETSKSGFWQIGSIGKPSSNQFQVPEGSLRWYAPEVFLRVSSGDANKMGGSESTSDFKLSEESSYSSDVAGDTDLLSTTTDIFSLAMLLYFLIAEKKPFYNLLWNEAIYRAWGVGQRPTMPNISYLGRDEHLKPLCDVMESCWSGVPSARPSAKALSASIEDQYKTFLFDLETKRLEEINKSLAALEAEKEATKSKLETNEKKAKSGDAAIEQKRKEFSEAYGNKQRQELQALIDKGSSRLVDLRKEIVAMEERIKRLDGDIRATKNKISAQMSLMRGGRDYILRHRTFKECTDSEALILRYKQFVTDEEIDAAIGAVTSVNAASAVSASGGSNIGGGSLSISSVSVSSPGVSRKGLLQKYIFECTSTTRSFEDDLLELELASGNEAMFASDVFASDCAFALSSIRQHSIQASDIPRYVAYIPILGADKIQRPNLSSMGGSNRSLVSFA